MISISKVCKQQYDLNPPFSCTENIYPQPLAVLSPAFANVNALATFLAILIGTLLLTDAESSSSYAVASNKDEQGDLEMTAGNNNNDDGSEVHDSEADGSVTRFELAAALRREKQQHAKALEKTNLEHQQRVLSLEKQVEGIMALLKATSAASAPATQHRTNGSARVGVVEG